MLPLQADDLLDRAGENRPELEKALQSPYAEEIRWLLERAPQFDLVNLTAAQLIENSSWAAKARHTFPWASKIPDPVWREYVLPWRVAEENLDAWRPELYALAEPLVKDAPSAWEATQRINAWLYSDDSPTKFVVSESRDMSPSQQLKLGHGRCWELNLLYTALCRSVGIPCRMQGVPWWIHGDFYHYWSQAYDEQTGQWFFCEPNKNGVQRQHSKSPAAIVVSYPAVGSQRDLLNRHRFDLLDNATNPGEPSRGMLQAQVNRAGASQTNACVTLYVFNLNAWRVLWQGRTDAQGTIRWPVGANGKITPLLLTASISNETAATTVSISSNQTIQVALDLADSKSRLDDLRIPMKLK